jgi:murein L,D-transpeptidase YcbB/YkuD
MSRSVTGLVRLSLAMVAMFLAASTVHAENENYYSPADSQTTNTPPPPQQNQPVTTAVNSPNADTDARRYTNNNAPETQPAQTYASSNSQPVVINQNYTRLQQILPLYEQAAAHPWVEIPLSRQKLKLGSRNSNVILLRQRLQSTNDLSATEPLTSRFDRTLARAVKLYQWRNGLQADGVVGFDTLASLNVPADVRLQQIRINMQRWEQLSPQLGDRYIMINIPEYQLHLIDDNREVLTMKVVVGKPARQTPQLMSTINRIIFNPKWNVPEMIAKNDIIPKVIEDPSYLNTNGIRIFNSDQTDSYEISKYDVNWEDARENGFPYHFRQDPGMKNALGLVKFEFPNSYNVYLHDTPAKALFSNTKRDFSSGCIRLEKPFALVDYLTANDDRMDGDKIKDTLGSRKTTYFRVDAPLPIVITYLTTWVDDQGYAHFADDIYHLDNPQMESDIPQDGHHEADTGY